jgi:plastocyanin
MKSSYAAAILLAVPLGTANAGDLQGKVTSKGMTDNANAVVYVAAIPGKSFPAPTAPARIDQRNVKFQPHVLPVLVGTTVEFLNSDTVSHNVFTPDACAGKFNLGTWAPGASQEKSHTFTKACAATLLCLIHPEMEAFVVVVPTPYFAATAADGSYKIVGVPDGSYTVKVWHPKLKTIERAVTVNGTTQVDLELSK